MLSQCEDCPCSPYSGEQRHLIKDMGEPAELHCIQINSPPFTGPSQIKAEAILLKKKKKKGLPSSASGSSQRFLGLFLNNSVDRSTRKRA